MMKMEKARRIIEVVVKGSPVGSCMRRTMIAGLLLAASATAALAADPAAGEKIFKTQCGIAHAVTASQNRIGPTLFGVVGRLSGSVRGFTTPPTTRNSASLGTPPSSTNTSLIRARWCRTRRWSTPA
jgi:cytochrome c